MKRTFYITTLLAAVFTSCEHKDLCYMHPHTTEIHVLFDWSYAPDAETNQEVEGMCVWFYPVDEAGEQTGEPLRFDLAGMKGGTVNLPAGRYNVLYYNNDYETVQFRNSGDFWEKECFTREGSLFEPVEGYAGSRAGSSPRAEGTEDQRVVITPEMMWGDNAMNLEIGENGLSYWFVRDGETEQTTIENSDMRFTLMPHEQVCRYTLEIRNVEHLENVTQMCASLSGMSGSVFCAAEALKDEEVTLPFEATSDGPSTITAELYTFGHHPDNDEPHKLVLYTWMTDGTKWYYTFDVTRQVDEAPDRRHVHLVIDGLSLPEPIGEDSGFRPDVDGWTEENHDIIL